MIPLPIITFIVTKAISGILDIISARSKANAGDHRLALEKAAGIEKGYFLSCKRLSPGKSLMKKESLSFNIIKSRRLFRNVSIN